MSDTRLHKYDTMKGVLIFLMILGHIIGEVGGGIIPHTVLFWIFTFHMPLFMAITGRFAQFKPIDSLLYIVLFLIFKTWFVLAVALYYLCIPLLARIKTKNLQLLAIAGSLLVGLLFGFLPLGNTHDTLTRCVTFFPYFLIGYYRVHEWVNIKHKTVLGILLFAGTIFVMPLLYNTGIIPLFMCDQYGYHTIWHRIGAYCVGTLWIAWISAGTPNKSYPIITKLGQYTLWIYLLHQPILPFVSAIVRRINQMIGSQPFILQIGVSIVWIILLFPIAFILQKGMRWCMKQWKPINHFFQKKCLPK